MRCFSIAGTGRLGTALAAALVRSGWRAVVLFDKDIRAARRARRLVGQGRASSDLRELAGAAGLVIVAVPDDAVPILASRLARMSGAWDGRLVFHTSGLLPASVLRPLAARGAFVASVHPAQSFPRPDAPGRLFRGITWALEGDATAVEEASRVVKDLRGNALLLSAKDKPLYHAACSLASNGLVALEAAAVDILQAMGLGDEQALAVLIPLAEGTLQNVKKLGPAAALTGPVARGDQGTVRKHLQALMKRSEARAVYQALGRHALRLARERGLPAGRLRAMRRLLGGR